MKLSKNSYFKISGTPVEDQIPVEETEDKKSEDLNPESVKQNIEEDVGKNDIEGMIKELSKFEWNNLELISKLKS